MKTRLTFFLLLALTGGACAQVYIQQSIGYGFDLGNDVAEYKIYGIEAQSTGKTYGLMNGLNYSIGLGFVLTDKLSLELGYNYSRMLDRSFPKPEAFQLTRNSQIKDVSLKLGAYWEWYKLLLSYNFKIDNFLMTVQVGPSLFQGAVIEDIYYKELHYNWNSQTGEFDLLDREDGFYARVRAKSYNTLGLHAGMKLNYQLNRNVFVNAQVNFNRASFEPQRIRLIRYHENGRGSILSIPKDERQFYFERHESSFDFYEDFQPPRIVNRAVRLLSVDFRVGLDFYIDKKVLDYLK